jgi:hypothetical protein
MRSVVVSMLPSLGDFSEKQDTRLRAQALLLPFSASELVVAGPSSGLPLSSVRPVSKL